MMTENNLPEYLDLFDSRSSISVEREAIQWLLKVKLKDPLEDVFISMRGFVWCKNCYTKDIHSI